MKYLLDTCVISELIKPDFNKNLNVWLQSEKFNNLNASVISIGEIWRGIQKLPDSIKKRKLSDWFDNEVVKFYYKRMIPVDFDTVLVWGKLYSNLEKIGKPMPTIDSFIASTALAKDLTVATRNTNDFINSGCKLFNPWE